MPLSSEAEQLLDERVDVEWRQVAAQTEEALLENIGNASAVLLGLAPFTEAVVAAAPLLKVVARRGVGYDHVDVPALTRAGVVLAVTGTANSSAVAEHVLHLMMTLAKRSHLHDRGMRQGRWAEMRALPPSDIAGRRVLLLGLGRIGRELLRRLLAMDMEAWVHDPYVPAERITAAGGVTLDDWRPALPEVDYVTVNCRRTEETTGMLGDAEFAAMRSSTFVINTAHGGIVDEASLYRALRDGAIAGAGIDAYETEPPPDDLPLFELENVVFTPHVAGATVEALNRMDVRSVRNIFDLLDGSLDPQYAVNPELLSTR